jgi:preprotein translocase subunit SecG
MYTFLLVTHILVALVLVIVVLIQAGKGGGLGAGFGGGGANTLFGSSGGGNFFTKLTMCLAAVFVCTSLGLTIAKNKSLKTSIFDQNVGSGTNAAPGAAAPTASPAPAAPAATTTAPAAPAATPKAEEAKK